MSSELRIRAPNPAPAVGEEVEIIFSLDVDGLVMPPDGVIVSVTVNSALINPPLPAVLRFLGGEKRSKLFRVRCVCPGTVQIRAATEPLRPRLRIPRINDVIGDAIYPKDTVLSAREVFRIRPSLPFRSGHCNRTSGSPPLTPISERASNWYGNHVKDLPVIKLGIGTDPRMSARAAEVVAAVRFAQTEAAAGRGRPGVQGSAWSYTDCVINPETGLLLNTDGLKQVRTEVLCEAVTSTDLRSRLLHVEAGIKLYELNCILNDRGLAMPTLGGSAGQSLAGAMGTGVHGSDISLPPVADCVRAVHLIGAGGQEWWIEPISHRLTDPLVMLRLRNEGVFCSNIRIEYSDDLFNAVLVSMGCAGVIYAVVVEAREAFNLRTIRASSTWDEAQAIVRNIASGRGDADFIDINIHPAHRSCRVTRRYETDSPLRASAAPTGDIVDAARIANLIGPGALVELTAEVAALIGRLIGIVARIVPPLPPDPVAILELTTLGIDPFSAAGTLSHIESYFELLGTLALDQIDLGDDEGVARILPLAINYVWTLGMFARSGRAVVDVLQDQLILVFSPDKDAVEESYIARTGQPVCDGIPQPHSAILRLVTSFEFAVPIKSAVEFANEVINIISELRGGPDALVVNINLRFTRATRALLGMQQFEKTCHFEIYTFKGIAGNERFHQRLESLARRFQPGAIPHWGQLHSPDYNFSRLFGPKLAVWRWAMNYLASNGEDRLGLFWSDFVRDRGLLGSLSRPSMIEPPGMQRLSPVLTSAGTIHLYAVGLGSLWVLKQRAPNDHFLSWVQVANSIHRVAVTIRGGGNTALFRIDSESRMSMVIRRDSINTLSGVSVVMRSDVRDVTVCANTDGRLELLAVTNRNRLYHTSQAAASARGRPESPWRAWSDLGQSASRPVIGQNLDGRLEAFAIGSDGRVLSSYQLSVGGEWTSWTSVGGSATDIALGRNEDGRLELFIVTPSSTLEHRYQVRPNSHWVEWGSLGGSIRQIKVVSNQDGRLEIFAISTENSLDHIYQLSPNSGWSSWQRFAGSAGAREVAACLNERGRIEAFIIRGPEGSVHRIVQAAPPSTWGAWHGLGQPTR